MQAVEVDTDYHIINMRTVGRLLEASGHVQHMV